MPNPVSGAKTGMLSLNTGTAILNFAGNMIFFPSNGERTGFYWILTWLHFVGAFVIVVLNALYSAVESPLGREISAGESPDFAWIRANITTCIGLGLVYLIVVIWIQLRQMRQLPFVFRRLSSLLLAIHPPDGISGVDE
jgi:hypothetical protein